MTENITFPQLCRRPVKNDEIEITREKKEGQDPMDQAGGGGRGKGQEKMVKGGCTNNVFLVPQGVSAHKGK